MFCSRCGTEVQQSSKFCPSCGLDLAAQTPLGRVSTEAPADKTEVEAVRAALKDEYEILEELGRGGMAVVYKALDKQLDREVAVKVLPFSLAFDAEFVERFQREARTAAKLEHPSIIPIYRVGRSGRVIYFVMKFLRGSSLSEMLEKRGVLPPQEIRELLIQTAAALGYAHKRGIVHRDIKPDNIMFDEIGHAVLTDFGIAKAASGTRLTGTGMSIGTPHYMSPEQARAQKLDGRSDIYSLGVLAYQCLTGRVPFDGEDAFSIGYKHIMEELEEPPLQSSEQRELFQSIRRMMAKTAEERFQSAEELIEELKGRVSQVLPPAEDMASAPTVALSAVETTPTQQATAALARPSTPTTPMPRAEPPPPPAKPKKRRGGLIAASFLVMLGLGGGGGYYYYTNYVQVEEPAPAGPLQSGPTSVDSAALALADSARLADSASADTAASLTAALPDSGWLVVNGAPRGARYIIDDTPRSSNQIRLQTGTYQLLVTAANYHAYEGAIYIARGDSQIVTVDLERMVRTRPTQTVETTIGDPAPPRTPPARAQCDRPTQENYNLDSACFDRRPRLLTDPSVPIPDGAQVGPNPTPVIVLVQVGTDGRAKSRTVARGSSDPRFTILALRYAMSQSYQPAVKADTAVDAWLQVQFFPRQR
ncbi:MAG: protein kinase [Gemmatimonadetes bacterium]|nr:protein kinase [Gemmatimonadota bacterium]